MDVRIGAPKALWPAQEHVALCRGFAAASPGPGSRSPTTRWTAVDGVDFIHTDVWVSMGEPIETWGERIDAAAAVPGQRRR